LDRFHLPERARGLRMSEVRERPVLPMVHYDGAMLEMRTVCERCAAPLEATGDALICSYECTFCAPCAEALNRICPNCAGELVARPKRVPSPRAAADPALEPQAS